MNSIPEARRTQLVNAFWSQLKEDVLGLPAGLFNTACTQVRLCNLTWELYSRDRWGFANQWQRPVWRPRRHCRQGIPPGQRAVSHHQTVLRSADQAVASRNALLQRLLCPGDLTTVNQTTLWCSTLSNLNCVLYFRGCFVQCWKLTRIRLNAGNGVWTEFLAVLYCNSVWVDIQLLPEPSP